MPVPELLNLLRLLTHHQLVGAEGYLKPYIAGVEAIPDNSVPFLHPHLILPPPPERLTPTQEHMQEELRHIRLMPLGSLPKLR